MSKLALQLIAENKRTKNPFLDLSMCSLKNTLPSSLAKCTWLEILDLSSWQKQDKGRRELNPANVNNNTFANSNCLKILKELTILKDLRLGGCEISDLTFIKEVKSLRNIDLGINKINNICFLEQLTNLQYLNLGDNQIIDISFLEKLTNLDYLDLSENQITDISFLEKLINLEYLDLHSNQITDIRFLEKIVHLNSLNLHSNQITDTNFLKKLTDLQYLSLGNNKITDIKPLLPLLLAGLEVDLDEKNIWGLERKIGLINNPITNPPLDIIKRGREAVIRFFEGELETKYEGKLLIVGEPEAGKTTLRKLLTIPNYKVPDDKLSTVGIEVDKWKVKYPKSRVKTMNINVWDFGGQEIQYLTHQFFLTSDALYVLLTSARKDLDNLDYWFNIIRLLGKNESNQNSKLMVVANEIKMKPVTHFVEKDFKERYHDLDFECFSVNFATNQNKDGRFKTLQHKIEENIALLPSMGRKLPVKWGIVRQELTKRKENSISIEKYLEICAAAGLDKDSAYDLSSYLHTIGDAIHFQNDYKVDDFIILSPKWAVDAVYAILKNSSIKDGHFTQKQVYQIWQQNGYAKEEWSRLLRLMVKDNFEVSYPLPENSNHYISPQLLSDEQPHYEWNREDSLKFRYSYPFMPKGILSRFIVRLHEDIEYRDGSGLVWKTGVVLRDKYTDYLAQIREIEVVEKGFKRKVIDIEIKGEKNQRKTLLKKVCKSIEKIHNDAFSGLPFERLIPCNCPDCEGKEDITFYDYSELLKRYEKGKNVECKKDFQEVNINDIFEEIVDLDAIKTIYLSKAKFNPNSLDELPTLQDPFQVKQKSNEIFFSYAWGDEKETGESREKIVNDLYESLKSDNYTVVIDKVELGYRGLISNFMGRIGKGDFVIVALTDKYFKSPYCMFELYEVYRNSRFEREEFIKKIYPIRVEKIAFDKPEIYIDYWKAEKQKLEEFIKNYITDGIESKFKEFTQIQDITSKIGSILGILKDMNSLNKELLSKDNFAEIKKAIEDRTKLN